MLPKVEQVIKKNYGHHSIQYALYEEALSYSYADKKDLSKAVAL